MTPRKTTIMTLRIKSSLNVQFVRAKYTSELTMTPPTIVRVLTRPRKNFQNRVDTLIIILKITFSNCFVELFFSMWCWTFDDCSYNMDKRESRDESFRLNLKTRHVTRFFFAEPESSPDAWIFAVPRRVPTVPCSGRTRTVIVCPENRPGSTLENSWEQ